MARARVTVKRRARGNGWTSKKARAAQIKRAMKIDEERKKTNHAPIEFVHADNIDALKKWRPRTGDEWPDNLMPIAAMYGKIEMLRHLIHAGCPANDALWHAARAGQFECMKIIPATPDDFKPRIAQAAAHAGSIHCLKYAVEAGTDIIAAFAMSGSAIDGKSLDCLKFLTNNGMVWTWQATSAAAWINWIEGLQYLIQAGCPVNDLASKHAAMHGNIEMLQILHEAGCEMSLETWKSAATRSSPDVLQWLYNSGTPVPTHPADNLALTAMHAYADRCLRQLFRWRIQIDPAEVKDQHKYYPFSSEIVDVIHEFYPDLLAPANHSQ